MNARLNQKARLRTGAIRLRWSILTTANQSVPLTGYQAASARFVIQRVSLERSGFLSAGQDGTGQTVVCGRENLDDGIAGFARVFLKSMVSLPFCSTRRICLSEVVSLQ